MKIDLFWYIDEFRNNSIRPAIKVVDTTLEHGGLFANFLSDDGGMDYAAYSDDMTRLLNEIEAVNDGSLNEATFCTESWCANVNKNTTSISFAVDESYMECMDTKSFHLALEEWLKFIKAPPKLESKFEFAI